MGNIYIVAADKSVQYKKMQRIILIEDMGNKTLNKQIRARYLNKINS